MAVVTVAVSAVALWAPAPVEAARYAPTGPPPQCVIVDDVEGLGCVDAPLSAKVSGKYAAGQSFTTTTAPAGVPPCFDTNQYGCHINIYTPSVGRCVYLANNDPTDVRPCEPLSSEGSVLPTRTGNCSGGLGDVWSRGGPSLETYWISRAPQVADCVYEVPDARPIDNLLGPTFVLVTTSARECVYTPRRCTWNYNIDGVPANTYRTVAESVWLPVQGTLAPHAAFDATETSTPGYVSFTNRSQEWDDGQTTWEWDFGDGETSTLRNPSHLYEEADTYTVTLTMHNTEHPDRSVTDTVEITVPELTVAVYNPGADFGPEGTGNRFSIGDEFTARVTVGTNRYLPTVGPVGDIVNLPPQVELVDTMPVVSAFALGANATRSYDVTLRAIAPGNVTLRSTWGATDAFNRTLGPVEGTMGAAVSGLQVEITTDPETFVIGEDNDGDGEVTDADADVEVTVTVTNVSGGPITGITYDELDLASNVPGEPAVALELRTEPERGFVDLGTTPETDSDELTWVFRATDPVDANAHILVTGMADAVETRAYGEADIRSFTEKLIEATITQDAQSLRSGQVVRYTGTFTNVTDETMEDPTTVSFGVAHVLSGAFGGDDNNAGNGHFALPGSATPTGMTMFELEPGASIELESIVQTLESTGPSGFTVKYQIFPYVPDEDDPTEYVPADPENTEIVDTGGSSDAFTVKLTPVAEDAAVEAANWISCYEDLIGDLIGDIAYIGCKLGRGIETFGRGLGQIAYLGFQGQQGIGQAKAWMARTAFEFLIGDEAARQIIVDEIVAELTELKRLGHAALQNVTVDQMVILVGDMVYKSIDRMYTVFATGNLTLISGEVAEVVGENLDMAIEALVAARTTAKTLSALGGNVGLLSGAIEEGIRTRNRQAISDALEVIRTKGAAALPESRVLPAGVDVTDVSEIRHAYGVGRDDVNAVMDIAEDNGVEIVFRSRAPLSTELIKAKKALPKPQGVKTKGVNELDVKYLGYRDVDEALVVVAEPPLPYHPEGALRDAEIARYLDNNSAFQAVPDGPGKSDLRAALTERLQTRLKEWEDFAVRTGKDNQRAIWENDGIKVDFDPAFNGLDREFIPEAPNVNAKLEPIDYPDGRRAWKVKMEHPEGLTGPDGSAFWDITGDIDFLAILTPDGRVLGDVADPAQRAQELAQRAKIYQQLRDRVGMQHGESFTIVNPKHRTKYVGQGTNSEGGETLIGATHNRRLMTTYFDDNLSTLEGGPNAQLIDGVQRSFFQGLFTETASPYRALNLVTLAELNALYNAWDNVTRVFSASVLARLVQLLSDGDITPSFGREHGVMVQPSVTGGLEQYVPGEGAPLPPEGSRSMGAVTEAIVEPPARSSGADTPADPILAALVAAGFVVPVGAQGGEWVDVDPLDYVDGGRLTLAPMTYLADDVDAGTSEVPVLDLAAMEMPPGSEFFEPGDRVVVDPGGFEEEYATVASVSPFRLTEALGRSHEIGTMVLLLTATTGPNPDPANGPGPDPDPDPDPDPGSEPSAFVPLVPARLLETRSGSGDATVDHRFEGQGRVGADGVVELVVAGRGGVPVDAEAVMLNVTVVGPSGAGHATVYPCGVSRPLASNLNYLAGVAVPNAVLAKVGVGGKVCVHTHAETHLVVDVNGYVPAGGSFESVVPARLLETRSGSGDATVDHRFEGQGRVGADGVVELVVAGRGGVPVDAEAVMLNVTVVGPSGAGHATVYPCGVSRPLASNLNYLAGVAVPNAVLAKVGVGGKVCVHTHAETHLVVDVNGYVPAGGSFESVVPARLLETRSGSGDATVDHRFEGQGRVGADGVVDLVVVGRGGVPVDAEAVMLNVTVVGPSGAGHATVYPCGVSRPLASNLNYLAGVAVPNAVLAKVGVGGKVCVHTHAETHLVVDVNGYVTSGGS